MAGIAGAQIAALGAQPPIGGSPKAIADGTATSRGCTINFIGFGKGLSSEEPLPVDFNSTDDTVTEANSLGQLFAPTYTAVSGHPDRETLTWVDTTP